MRLRSVLTAGVCLVMTGVAFGQRDKLEVGDQAPGLDIDTWVKGEETAIETGNVYVVEFWATWCGPCRRSIPHLTKLQKEFEEDGLTIIGISKEEIEKVRPFVRNSGNRMNYTVAVDRNGSTHRAWFDAAGLKGIPAAFIVDRKGKIAYIGNPLQEDFESTLRRVMRGRFDPKLEKQVAPMIKAVRTQRKMKNWRVARLQYDAILEVDPVVFADVALTRFEMQLVDEMDPKGAYRYARNELIHGIFASDAEALRSLARKITTDPIIEDKDRDLDVALEAAEQALELMGRDNPKALSTVALVRFHRNEFEEAVALQKRAYFQASPRRKPGYKRILHAYQEAADREESVAGRSD